MPLLPGKQQKRVAQSPQPRTATAVGVNRLFETLFLVVEIRIQEREVKILLARKVVVQGALGEVGRGRDLVHCDVGVIRRKEQVRRCGEDIGDSSFCFCKHPDSPEFKSGTNNLLISMFYTLLVFRSRVKANAVSKS